MKVKLEDIQETNNGIRLCFSRIKPNQKGTLDLNKEEAFILFHNNPFLKEGDILEISIKKTKKAKNEKTH